MKTAVITLLSLAVAAAAFYYFRQYYASWCDVKDVEARLLLMILEHDPSVRPQDVQVQFPNGEWLGGGKMAPWPKEKLDRYKKALALLRADNLADPFVYDVGFGILDAKEYDLTRWDAGGLPMNIVFEWIGEGCEVRECEIALFDEHDQEVERLRCYLAGRSTPSNVWIPRERTFLREGITRRTFLYTDVVRVNCLSGSGALEQELKDAGGVVLNFGSATTMRVALVKADDEPSNSVTFNMSRIRNYLFASEGSIEGLMNFVDGSYEDPDSSRDWVAHILFRSNILPYIKPSMPVPWTSKPSGPSSADIREFVYANRDSLTWDAEQEMWLIEAPEGADINGDSQGQ